MSRPTPSHAARDQAFHQMRGHLAHDTRLPDAELEVPRDRTILCELQAGEPPFAVEDAGSLSRTESDLLVRDLSGREGTSSRQ